MEPIKSTKFLLGLCGDWWDLYANLIKIRYNIFWPCCNVSSRWYLMLQFKDSIIFSIWYILVISHHSVLVSLRLMLDTEWPNHLLETRTSSFSKEQSLYVMEFVLLVHFNAEHYRNVVNTSPIDFTSYSSFGKR